MNTFQAVHTAGVEVMVHTFYHIFLFSVLCFMLYMTLMEKIFNYVQLKNFPDETFCYFAFILNFCP